MKSTFKYGSLTGVIVGIFAIGFFTVVNGLNTSYGWGFQAANIRGISGLLTILVQGAGIYITMLAVKKEQANNLTYGQALKTGIIVAVLTAVFTALFGFIYCTVINPGYADYMVAEAQKVMIANKETQQQIAEHSKVVKNDFSPAMQVMQALVGQSVVGTVISFVMGAIVKNRG